MADGDDRGKWYFDLGTGQVTEGKAFGMMNRMGPYKTQVEAAHALDIARERSKQADEYDEKTDDWKES